MNLYLITYDLNKSGKNYDDLINAIKQYNYCKALYSAWFVKTNSTKNEIYNHLKPYIDNDDRIMIIKTNNNDIQGFLNKDVVSWLNN